MIHIRPEIKKDAPAVYWINQQAFGRKDEAKLVQALQANCDTLSLVAKTEDGQAIGHILFSPATIQYEGRTLLHGMALAPLAVLPAYQKQGIGGQLVRAGITAVRQTPATFIMLLGHADYYPRFGFVPSIQYGIQCEFNVPPEAFMLLPLQDGVLDGVQGTAVYRPEFRQL